MSLYSFAQLDERIRLAKQLGFWDDVAHWEAEKRRITGAAEVRSTDTTNQEGEAG
jgi:hypothetical protein